jgi:photosynthetic reaction center H subunit
MQHTGEITGYIDVAQLTLYAFWIFFFGLIYYLRREDKREGYPLVSEKNPNELVQGFPPVPGPKTFHMVDGTTVTVPRKEPFQTIPGVPIANFPGAALEPTGNPMIDGIGPAAYANRSDHPDHAYGEHAPKIVPLRAAGDFFLAMEDADPRGMDVIAGDGKVAGKIVDVWVDRSEVIIRYLEAEIPTDAGARRVLIPMPFAKIKGKQRQVSVSCILASHFATVPVTKSPDQVTMLEEDKISGYYGGGQLYATAGRLGPIL